MIRQLFDPPTSTYTYLVADPDQGVAALIDPVREQVDRDVQLLEELGLKLELVLETHVHADHVTGAGRLRDRLGAKTAVSKRAGVTCADLEVDGGDRLTLGRFELEVRATPGHTDGCVTYVARDGGRTAAFTGDALLIRGTGRTDFQQGDASVLFSSIREQVFTLPDDTEVFPGHDYKGRTVSTVGEEKRFNPRIGAAIDRPTFVQIMNALDLPLPRLVHIAVPANQACGTPWRASQPQEVAELGARVVDVRSPDEVTGDLGHVPGADLVPLDELGAQMERWDKDERLVIMCRSGRRSKSACDELAAAGFTAVHNLEGGMEAWLDAGLVACHGAHDAPHCEARR